MLLGSLVKCKPRHNIGTSCVALCHHACMHHRCILQGGSGSVWIDSKFLRIYETQHVIQRYANAHHYDSSLYEIQHVIQRYANTHHYTKYSTLSNVKQTLITIRNTARYPTLGKHARSHEHAYARTHARTRTHATCNRTC